MTIDDVLRWVADVNEEFQREEDQGVLQGRLDKAAHALAGKDACERLKRAMTMRYGMHDNTVVMGARKKKA